jgi:hypothetical protein
MAEAKKDSKEGLFELRPVRLTFPHLHVAHTPKPTKQNLKPRTQFQTKCIIDSVLLSDTVGRAQLGALIAEIKRIANDKFKDKAIGFMTKVLHSKQNKGDIASDIGIRSPFGDGAAQDFGANTLTFNLRSDYPFALVDNRNIPVPMVEGKNPSMFYPGCYVSVFVKVGGYNNEGQGVSLWPQGMKFWADGERLDNRVDVSDLWGGPLDPSEQTDVERLMGSVAA